MNEIVRKIIKPAALFVIIVSIGIVFWKGARWSLGFLAASAWAIANFGLTLGLLDIAILERSPRQLKLFLCIKFPVLYLAGFAILVSHTFPTISILAGLLVSTVIIGIIKLWPKIT